MQFQFDLFFCELGIQLKIPEEPTFSQLSSVVYRVRDLSNGVFQFMPVVFDESYC
jgi:hypothetical protein